MVRNANLDLIRERLELLPMIAEIGLTRPRGRELRIKTKALSESPSGERSMPVNGITPKVDHECTMLRLFWFLFGISIG